MGPGTSGTNWDRGTSGTNWHRGVRGPKPSGTNWHRGVRGTKSRLQNTSQNCIKPHQDTPQHAPQAPWAPHEFLEPFNSLISIDLQRINSGTFAGPQRARQPDTGHRTPGSCNPATPSHGRSIPRPRSFARTHARTQRKRKRNRNRFPGSGAV